MFTQLNGIEMRLTAVFEHRHQLMLASIQRAHSTIVLIPNTDIFKIRVMRMPCAEELEDVPPIHAYIMQGSIAAVLSDERNKRSEERGEFLFRHFTTGHDELIMFDFALAAYMSVDAHIIRWVSEDHVRSFGKKQTFIALPLKRIGADQTILAHYPNVTKVGNRWLILQNDRNIICQIMLYSFAIMDDQIQLRCFKARDFEVKIKIHVHKVDDFDPKQILIIPRIHGELIIGKAVCFNLCFG